MQTLSAVVAIVSLTLVLVLVPVLGPTLLAMVFVGLLLLALVGVVRDLDDRSVQQREPALDGKRWRNGS